MGAGAKLKMCSANKKKVEVGAICIEWVVSLPMDIDLPAGSKQASSAQTKKAKMSNMLLYTGSEVTGLQCSRTGGNGPSYLRNGIPASR